jgi:hypothetical protein
MSDDDTRLPAFSRSAESCIFGKCTAEVNKFSVPEMVKADLARAIAASDFNTEAEYLRTFLLLHLYGKERIINLQAQRINSMGLIGGIKGEEGAAK